MTDAMSRCHDKWLKTKQKNTPITSGQLVDGKSNNNMNIPNKVKLHKANQRPNTPLKWQHAH